MGMTINLTLLVQIVHFILAYILITRLLLRPGYKAVKSDANRVRQVKSRIVARQELIAHKQTYKKGRWELFQDYFTKQKPKDLYYVWVGHAPKKAVEIKKLSKKELDELSDTISTAVKDKVIV